MRIVPDAPLNFMRLLLTLSLLLSGCMLTAHKIEMQQGNYVDREMIGRLKPEMTRSQVRFILGTPLVADVFHPDRWDYIYLTGEAGDVSRQRGITVVFDGDTLKRIEGDLNPGESLTLAPGNAGPDR